MNVGQSIDQYFYILNMISFSMKVRDAIKLLESDGGSLSNRKGVTCSSSTRSKKGG